MSSYLLDTSVIIDYLRDKEEVVKKVDALEGELSSSFICLSELYEGVARVKNQKEVEEKILNFFATLSRTWALDYDISRTFGLVRASLKKSGTIIEDLDIFLGATCIARHITLATRNPKHFSRIPGLEIVSI